MNGAQTTGIHLDTVTSSRSDGGSPKDLYMNRAPLDRVPCELWQMSDTSMFMQVESGSGA